MALKKIYLVRHGESQGNVDKTIYKEIPDFSVKLTKKGNRQAIEAGEQLSTLIYPTNINASLSLSLRSIGVYYSPFIRTIETTNHILSGLRNHFIFTKCVKEAPSLREQEWQSRYGEEESMALTGINTKSEKERLSFGIFHYRFDSGESCADVYDRCLTFINKLRLEIDKPNYPDDLIIVSHGMTMRLFIMALMEKSVMEFETWKKPDNCAIWKMDYISGEFSFDFNQIDKRVISNSRQIPIKL